MSNVEQLLYLLDEAFEDNAHHALLKNLESVGADDWDWKPLGGARTIREIVGHVGACKYMYENHAFGDARLTWTDPLVDPQVLPSDGSVEAVLEWVREGQRRLRESVARLDDDELLAPRKTNWGEMMETRWIISVMIEHDLYHAGEINHIRALRQGNDRWAYEPD